MISTLPAPVSRRGFGAHPSSHRRRRRRMPAPESLSSSRRRRIPALSSCEARRTSFAPRATRSGHEVSSPSRPETTAGRWRTPPAAVGARAVICMSELVPRNKLEAIEALGAEIRIVGRSQDEAEAEAQRLATEEGLALAHPFDDPLVIAGQGTVGIEILEDQPEVDVATSTWTASRASCATTRCGRGHLRCLPALGGYHASAAWRPMSSSGSTPHSPMHRRPYARPAVIPVHVESA